MLRAPSISSSLTTFGDQYKLSIHPHVTPSLRSPNILSVTPSLCYSVTGQIHIPWKSDAEKITGN
jgi:hypothetical protein